MNMRSLLSLLAFYSFFGASFGCSICGTDMMIGNVEGIIEIPGRENKTCAEIQELGDEGLINDAQCDELQAYVQEPCECQEFKCEICGEGRVSTDPGGIVDIPGDGKGSTTCAAVYTAAQNGMFNVSFCTTVQDVVEQPCGCEGGSPAPSPELSMSEGPTRTPASRPTNPPSPPTPVNVSGSERVVIWLALAGPFLQFVTNMIL